MARSCLRCLSDARRVFVSGGGFGGRRVFGQHWVQRLWKLRADKKGERARIGRSPIAAAGQRMPQA